MSFLFISILTTSALVLLSRNIVYSLVFLILTFFLSAVLLLSVRLDFLAYVLVIVYVGAIAILFLFVVMTLDIGREERFSSAVRNTGGYFSHIIALLFSSIVLWSIYSIITPIDALLSRFNFVGDPWSEATFSNGVYAISASLYTHNFPYLVIAGLLLLVAMIGAVLITLTPARPTQVSSVQGYRSIDKAVKRNS